MPIDPIVTTPDITSQISETLAANGQDIALITPDGQAITYDKIQTTAASFHHHAIKHGIASHDRVVLDVPNHVVRFCLLLALAPIGAITLIGNTARGYVKDGLPVDVVITTQPALQNIARSVHFTQDWFQPPDGDASQFAQTSSDFDFGAISDPIMISATSGTTGKKKYVEWSSSAVALRVGLFDKLLGTDNRRCLVTLGMDAFVGMQQMLRILKNAGLYLRPADSPDATLDVIGKFAVEEIFTTPNILADLVDAVTPDDKRTKSLRRIVIVGSAISSDLLQRAEKALAPVYSVYGTTEFGPIAAGTKSILDKAPGVVGRLLDWAQLEIVNERDQPLPTGQEGEIRVSVPDDWRVTSYLHEEIFEAQSSIRGKWLYPGDHGTINADGIVTITGRVLERINVAGNKYAPSTIETALTTNPNIQQAHIQQVHAFALPNQLGYDDIAVALVSKTKLNLDEITNALNNQFGQDLTIHAIQVDSLPYNAAGKIDAEFLRGFLG